MDQPRSLWIDPSAGVAGDMLLGALLDAGASLEVCQAAVDAVIPGTVRLHLTQVVRGGLRAASAHVELLAPDQPHRAWSTIRELLGDAALPDGVRSRALAAFTALASAEARVHGVAADDVHFHEVGSWDSIADVVGVCAALDDLGIGSVVVGELALGSGTVRTQHGLLPVPAPAVLELCRGWAVTSGGTGELATPTGVALVTALASGQGPLPVLTVDATGAGAGSRERPDRPNVVRVVIGSTARPGADPEDQLETLRLIESTVDDLDPRVWPTVVDDLLAAGAADAWLTPVLMKKGRPGHVLSVLAAPDVAPLLRALVLDRTSALGVRQWSVRREVLERAWIDVSLGDTTLPVKVGHRGGVLAHATPEFEDAARLAAVTGRGVREVLEAASAAAVAAGLVPGAPLPSARSDRTA